MALLPGFVSPSSLPGENALRLADELSAFALDNYPYHESLLAGPLTMVAPGFVAVALGMGAQSGFLSHRYLDDYYYRIHLNPNPLELGNLLANQSVDVEVWNSWFAPQLLTSVTGSNNGGLTLTEPTPAPTTFQPLDSRIYALAASVSGPPAINAGYTFVFPTETLVLSITGDRVVVFPFPPNWSRPVVERLGWLTEVLASYSGGEQRIELRAAPRRQFRYHPTVYEQDQQRLDALLFEAQARVFALPIWPDVGFTQLAAEVGGSELAVATDDLDYHPGGLALLWQSPGRYEPVEIDTLTATTLTLKNPLDQAWANNSRIYPVRSARLRPSQRLGRLTPNLSDGDFVFDVVDNDNTTAAESPTLYRGQPVLETQPKWRSKASSDYLRKLQSLDFKTGLITVDDESGAATEIVDYYWQEHGRPAITALRRWLFARRGRLVPIWLPTRRVDLTLVSDILSNAGSIDVAAIDYARFLLDRPNRRDICITLNDGSAFYRRITAATNYGSHETLALDSPLGVDAPLASVQKICFLVLCRLNADAIELSWSTPQLIGCKHKFRSLIDAEL